MHSVFVKKEDFNFNCAHFIASPNFRETLHGHNYRAEVKLNGNGISKDGYLIDFGEIKKAMRVVCRTIHLKVILPAHSQH